MTSIFENLAITWKKKIKYMQILFLVLALVSWFVFDYVKGIYDEYTIKKQQLLKAKDQYTKAYNDYISKTIKFNTLSKIYSISGDFIQSYNTCFIKHIQKKYSITTGDFIDLPTCIDLKLKNISTGYNGFVKVLKPEEIERIGIMFGIYEDTNEKMDFDEKRVLASLDKNIFLDLMEKSVSFLTFSKPVLLDKKNKFYKVSFTFQTMVNYSQLQNILKRMQDMIHTKYNLYYTISSISNYDITSNAGEQQVNIQGNFYFTKK